MQVEIIPSENKIEDYHTSKVNSLEMTVKLSGFQTLEFTENKGTPVRELVDQVLFYYEIPCVYARGFAACRGNHIYEYNEVIPHKHHEEQLIELIPKYINQIDPDMPITLIYCVVSYCFFQFKQNVYNYTETLNLQIILCMKKIFEESDRHIQEWINQKRADLSIETPQSQSQSLSIKAAQQSQQFQYTFSKSPQNETLDLSFSVSTQLTEVPICIMSKTINVKKLFPEKFVAAYNRVQKHISLMELLFFDEFNALSFKDKLLYTHKLFQKSSYYGLYIYPCLDVQIDWVSYVGITFDGICLLDAELSLGYAFFPFFIVQSITCDDHHQIFIDIDYQQSKGIGMYAQSELSSFSDYKVFTKKQVKPILLHTVAKIPDSDKNEHEKLGTAIFNKQITNTQKQLNDDVSRTDVLMVGISDTLKQRRQREHIILRFLNRNQQTNFMQTYKIYSEQQNYAPQQSIQMRQFDQKDTNNENKINNLAPFRIFRNLRVQSKSQVELFYNAYLNACVTFCCSPNNKIDEQCRTIVDLQYFKNKKLTFEIFSLENDELLYSDLKAITQSFKLVFGYTVNDKLMSLKKIQDGIMIEEQLYTNGVGTPYSPFIESGNQLIENMKITRIIFSNNSIAEKRQITQIVEFLHIQQIQQSLKDFTFSYNKLNYEYALMLGNAIQNFIHLTELNLSYTDISPVALCNILYLLDRKEIFLKSLRIAGTKFKTKAQIQQLALYILHAFDHNQYPMVLVDLSGCFSSQQKAQQFAQFFITRQKTSQFQYLSNMQGNRIINKDSSGQNLLLVNKESDSQQYIVVDTLVVKQLDFLTVQELLDICRIIEL